MIAVIAVIALLVITTNSATAQSNNVSPQLCRDGTSSACAMPLNHPMKTDMFYTTSLSASACRGDIRACSESLWNEDFDAKFAHGVTCSSLQAPVHPSNVLIAVASIAFLIGLLALFSPWVPTCCCGKFGPLIAWQVLCIIHVALFADIANQVRRNQSAVHLLAQSWSPADIQAVLTLLFQSSPNTPLTGAIVVQTKVISPFIAYGALLGVSTGPLGFVSFVVVVGLVVLLFCACILCMALCGCGGNGSGGVGGGSGSFGDNCCSGDGNSDCCCGCGSGCFSGNRWSGIESCCCMCCSGLAVGGNGANGNWNGNGNGGAEYVNCGCCSWLGHCCNCDCRPCGAASACQYCTIPVHPMAQIPQFWNSTMFWYGPPWWWWYANAPPFVSSSTLTPTVPAPASASASASSSSSSAATVTATSPTALTATATSATTAVTMPRQSIDDVCFDMQTRPAIVSRVDQLQSIRGQPTLTQAQQILRTSFSRPLPSALGIAPTQCTMQAQSDPVQVVLPMPMPMPMHMPVPMPSAPNSTVCDGSVIAGRADLSQTSSTMYVTPHLNTHRWIQFGFIAILQCIFAFASVGLVVKHWSTFFCVEYSLPAL